MHSLEEAIKLQAQRRAYNKLRQDKTPLPDVIIYRDVRYYANVDGVEYALTRDFTTESLDAWIRDKQQAGE